MWLELVVPVWLELGVPVCDELAVPVLLELDTAAKEVGENDTVAMAVAVVDAAAPVACGEGEAYAPASAA